MGPFDAVLGKSSPVPRAVTTSQSVPVNLELSTDLWYDCENIRSKVSSST